ncbi:MAG: cadherin-like beta sandwich domain-containing protein [Lachnospiraceae bacterium]|nr:cadherin-like beta sandwich domain-containing protein [Lachnospiraceae bacterium]
MQVSMTVEPEVSAIDIYLSYGTDLLQFSDCSGGTGNLVVQTSNGKIRINDYAGNGTASLSYTLTFQALQGGSAVIGIDSAEVFDTLGDEMTLAVRGSSVVTIQGSAPTEVPTTEPPTTEPPTTEPPTTEPPTTEAPTTEPPTTEEPTTEPPSTEAPTTAAPSSEKRLVSLVLSPGTLSPAFNPDVYEYTLNVSADTTGLSLQFMPMDSKASAFYWPYVNEIPTGKTDFYVRVTAEDGVSRQDYHVQILRPEPETAAPPATTETPTEEPTTEEPTIEPVTEESTEESTDESNEETTDEPSAPVYLTSKTSWLLVLPLPEDSEPEIPAGYIPAERLDEEGSPYTVWIPEDSEEEDPPFLVYAVKVNEDNEPISEPALYVVDPSEDSLQRYGLIVPETTEEETTEEPTTEESTEETTEPTTEEETETLPEETTEAPAETTPAPQTEAPTQTPTSPEKGFPFGNVRFPWLLLLGMGLLFVICLVLLFMQWLRNNRLSRLMEGGTELSSEEEEQFLSVGMGSVPKADDSFPPASEKDFEEIEVPDEGPRIM